MLVSLGHVDQWTFWGVGRMRQAGKTPECKADSEGKWFVLWGYWLLPKDCSPDSTSVRRLKNARTRIEETDRQLAKLDSGAMREGIGPQIALLCKRDAVIYNAQPHWALNQIRVSESAATDLLEEFRQFIQIAALEYCWPLRVPDGQVEWKKHSWKHSSNEDLQSLASDIKNRRYPPGEVLLDLIGSTEEACESTEEACELFRRAEKGDAEAVARVNCLFPLESQRVRIAEFLFKYKKVTEEPVPIIPGAGELAKKHTEVIVRSPDSSEARRARTELQRLISPRASKGSQIRSGRAPTQYHEDGIRLLFKMSYGLFKQLRQVNKVAASFGLSRRDVLRKFYPDLPSDPESFLGLEPLDGACQIAGKALDISSSVVDKIVFRRRTDKAK